MNSIPESDPRNKVIAVMKTLNPAYNKALEAVIDVIKEQGLCYTSEFIGIAEENKVNVTMLMEKLFQLGYHYVKHMIKDTGVSQEVLIDVRPMAAAMLLIYSDNDFAKTNSVLEFVLGVYGNATWEAALPVFMETNLLEEMYSSMGHNFTIMEIADNAVLDVPQNPGIILNAVIRHSHAMHELSKNDTELTNVFHLARDTFIAANAPKADKFLIYKGSAKGTTSAYNHFYRLANKIVDNARRKG